MSFLNAEREKISLFSLLGTELRFCACPARGLVTLSCEKENRKHVVYLRMFEGF